MHQAAGECSRCTRLGLQCLANEPSQRGRCSSAARLGTMAPRQKGLVSTGHGDGDDGNGATEPSAKRAGVDSQDVLTVPAKFAIGGVKFPLSSSAPSLHYAVGSLSEPRTAPLSSKTWSLQQHALTNLGSHTAKLHWVRSAFAVAARNRCYRRSHNPHPDCAQPLPWSACLPPLIARLSFPACVCPAAPPCGPPRHRRNDKHPSHRASFGPLPGRVAQRAAAGGGRCRRARG